MKRLTNEQKQMIADLKDSLTPGKIAKQLGISHQLVNYYFRVNQWSRMREKYHLTDSDKEYICNNSGLLTAAEMSIKLWGISTDTTRSRIYTFLERHGLYKKRNSDRQRPMINPAVVEMVRQAAQKYKKTA